MSRNLKRRRRMDTNEKKPKLIRVTTSDISLWSLLVGQLRFMNQYYDVLAVSADTGLQDKVRAREGVRVVEVPMHREISLKADWACLRQLVALFRKERPYIVHANTPKGSLLSMIAAKVAGVPHRIYLVTGLRYQGATGLFRFILQTMERVTCFCATKVIPEGEGVKRALQTDHITGKPLQVVNHGNINGKDLTYWDPKASPQDREQMRSRLGLEADDFVFLFVGRIVRDKGMHELAEAMRRLTPTHPKLRLVLCGDLEPDLDPLDQADEAFFREDPSVRCVGYADDVRPYMAAADALVFPSYREGFPNVVLEAGAMGLPAVVTDINGCNEIIIPEKNGTIIPPKDADALTRAMQRFVDEPDEVKRMAREARPLIASRYEQHDVWNALLATYRSL